MFWFAPFLAQWLSESREHGPKTTFDSKETISVSTYLARLTVRDIDVMKIRHALLVVLVLVFVAGCVSSNTGLLSPGYAGTKYPVLAAVHGVRKTTFAEDLHEIVTTHTPFSEISRNTNTVHAWLVHIKAAHKPMKVREVYILPGPARWGTKDRPVLGRVVRDGTTCVTEWTAGKGAKYIGNSWGMYPDDPLGEYHVVVFFDDRLAAEFKFRVVPESPQVTPSGE